MSINTPPIRLSLVEGTSVNLPESVVEFSEPFNRPILFELKGDPGFVPGAQITFKFGGERYLDQTHLALTPTFESGTRWPGTYRGTAAFSACPPFIFASMPAGCSGIYPNASGSVPYEIVIEEVTTTFTPSNNLLTGEVGRLLTDVPVVAPYNVAVEPRTPFVTASASRIYGSSSYALSVTVPTGTPRGTTLNGNVFVKICRDDPRICAYPHKGSPFNLPVAYTVR